MVDMHCASDFTATSAVASEVTRNNTAAIAASAIFPAAFVAFSAPKQPVKMASRPFCQASQVNPEAAGLASTSSKIALSDVFAKAGLLETQHLAIASSKASWGTWAVSLSTSAVLACAKEARIAFNADVADSHLASLGSSNSTKCRWAAMRSEQLAEGRSMALSAYSAEKLKASGFDVSRYPPKCSAPQAEFGNAVIIPNTRSKSALPRASCGRCRKSSPQIWPSWFAITSCVPLPLSASRRACSKVALQVLPCPSSTVSFPTPTPAILAARWRASTSKCLRT
mmetsp:Transcript_121748/g.191070  ORF Transcript_121748/g.191070 Transcript_121748/m.191070 type:complete len:283 (-) Transcript_121748:185-1033(-)